MRVGDLVKCTTVGDGALGVIAEFFNVSGLFGVILVHNNRMCCFQPQHLEVISASR